jgi:hypothetical protein
MNTPFVEGLLEHGYSVYSQTIEDGLVEEIFKNIGTTNKYFIEFGCWNGVHLSNTANLRLNEKWNGLLLEGNKEKAKGYDYVKHAFITADNVNDIFAENNVPAEYDLLSIDIDGNDYWVWKAIDESRFSARVVIIEYNGNFADQHRSCAIKYDSSLDSTVASINYYNATIPALKKLGESKGYSLIFRVNLHNLFFVKTELLHEDDRNIPLDMFLNKDGTARFYKEENEINKTFSDSKVYGDTILKKHWNNYADTSISIYWEQDFTKEWIDV